MSNSSNQSRQISSLGRLRALGVVGATIVAATACGLLMKGPSPYSYNGPTTAHQASALTFMRTGWQAAYYPATKELPSNIELANTRDRTSTRPKNFCNLRNGEAAKMNVDGTPFTYSFASVNVVGAGPAMRNVADDMQAIAALPAGKARDRAIQRAEVDINQAAAMCFTPSAIGQLNELMGRSNIQQIRPVLR